MPPPPPRRPPSSTLLTLAITVTVDLDGHLFPAMGHEQQQEGREPESDKKDDK